MLLVEDSEDDAFLLCSELGALGAKLDHRRVDNPGDMRVALADGDWDVIICDHAMPGFDSHGALEVLRDSGKDIPFIIYSGRLTEQQGWAAMSDGVQDFVPKGNLDRLVPVLERELRGVAARRAVRQADSRIKELAFYDALSSLPNHTLFRRRIDEWLEQILARGETPAGALFFVDIDRFLRINNSFGYETGNQILRQVAGRLAECVEQHGMVARLGGDEFGIFYPRLSEPDSVEAFGHWLVAAFDAPFQAGDLELYLTPSIGIALVAAHGTDAYRLIMSAETAVAAVKRAGGNGYRMFSPELNISSTERLTMEMDLRHAIARNQLALQFQPIVGALTGRTEGVEALLRWQHPHWGLISPGSFIPIADESGLIVEIGEWVLREAIQRCCQWHAAGHPELFVAVNVSAVQFAQPRLLQAVRRAIVETGIDPTRLELEITETVLMRDAESTISMLKALKNMGVRIAVDDFGTGYSSLSYLRRFPLDVLKVDRSFMRDLTRDEDDAAIVRAVLALAKTLRLATVAEGVEFAEQVRFLGALGCDRYQGFYFSRAVDPGEIDARLAIEEVGAETVH